jgi:putative transposase
MDEPSARIITRTSGMNPWRAGCGESRTSGSEGGPEKPTSRKTGRALRPDPYTEHPTREGKLYCAVVLDACSRRVVGWSIDVTPTAALVTNALGMAIESRKPTAGTLIHSDQGVQPGFKGSSQRCRVGRSVGGR